MKSFECLFCDNKPVRKYACKKHLTMARQLKTNHLSILNKKKV